MNTFRFFKFFPLRMSVVCAFCFFLSCTSSDTPKSAPGDLSSAPEQQSLVSSGYKKQRQKALETSADRIGLTLSPDRTLAYGIVVDQHTGKAVYSLACWANNDARVYLGDGTVLGEGTAHPAVQKKVKQCIESLASYLPRALPARGTPLPSENRVCFYLLTNRGTFSFEENLSRLQEQRSPWAPLYAEVEDIISEIKLIGAPQVKKQ